MRKQEVKKGLGLHARRVIAYTVLIIISFFCLFWFYVLFINATRSNGELQAGFTAVPSTHLFDNWNNLLHGTLPVIKGLVNSLIISSLSAVLTVYFSTMTAYAIHAYDFRLKKYIYTFILAVMMIPTQVTALGFIRLMRSMNLMDSFIPLIVPAVAAPITFFYMKQYMESTLPLSLIEAARIDGSGEFRTFNSIVLPLMKPAIAVQAIFGFVSSWNNYFTPALILQSDNKKTLPILIAQLRAADWLKFDMGQVYVMIAFSIVRRNGTYIVDTGKYACILHFPGYHRLFVPVALYRAGNCTWKCEGIGKIIFGSDKRREAFEESQRFPVFLYKNVFTE